MPAVVVTLFFNDNGNAVYVFCADCTQKTNRALSY
jgi:hypothetical protein